MLGVAAVTIGAAVFRDDGVNRPAVIALLLALGVLGSALDIPFMVGEEKTAGVNLTEACFLAGILLLPPLDALLVLVAATALGYCIATRSALKGVFNGAAVAFGGVLGLLTAQAVGLDTETIGIRSVAAGLAGCAVFWLATSALVLTAYALIDTVSVSRFVVSGLRVSFLPFVGTTAVGLMASLAGITQWWAPALVVVPIAALYVVTIRDVRARRDRERLRGLLRTAVDSHASMELGEVQGALCCAARDELRCRTARVDTVQPADGEWGVRLDVNGDVERWLVVAGRRGLEPFDAEDQKLLEAIGAVGSTALENARLVEQIRREGLHDSLTGLANQLLFQDRVAQAITQGRKARESFALLVLDLDSFKKVNDGLGHGAGNELLQRVAERLTGAVREVDTVARLSGDDFTILLPGIGTAETVGVVAGKLLEVLRRPFTVGGNASNGSSQEVFMTASIGVALFPDDGTQAEQLLKNADSALHKAKDAGRNRYQLYAADMNHAAETRLARESELHNALRRDELRLLYQPQIDLRTGRIVAVEALVRWQHPELGLLGPYEFVPLAEESGLITELDFWVMRHAAAQAKTWEAQGLPPVRVAVNLSGRHFQQAGLPQAVRAVLLETGLQADKLELEVTEGVAVREGEETITILQQLRDLGVSFAIDDFGTGYSMLGRLQRFPVDRLKIDRSFISEIASADCDAPIVAAMIAMGRSLRLEVVAEGVETLEQQDFLRGQDCDHAQGYLYSRPISPDDLAALLRANLTSAAHQERLGDALMSAQVESDRRRFAGEVGLSLGEVATALVVLRARLAANDHPATTGEQHADALLAYDFQLVQACELLGVRHRLVEPGVDAGIERSRVEQALAASGLELDPHPKA